MSYEATGTIKTINPVEKFDSGFQKRDFILKTNDPEYPEELKMELMGDKHVDKLNSFKEGDQLTVHFNLKGNEYNGRHFLNAHAWKLER